MRCPKCGYISFDHLERCKKCGKDIVEATADLDGTVFETVAPVFLKFETAGEGGGEGGMAAEAADQGIDLELDEEFEEVVTEVEVDQDDGIELVLDGEGVDDIGLGEDLDAGLAAAAGDETPDETIELADLPDTGEEGDLVLELGDDETAESGESGEIEGLQLDFGDIDISDLAPPEDDREDVEAEELTLDTADEAAPAMVARPAPATGTASGGLEDLEIDGLDLDSPPPVAGSAAGGRLAPAVKTGTALDDFDIDLGDLLSEGKSEKSVDNAA